MQRSDYLNPSELRSQCTGAANRLEEDQRALETVCQSIGRFAGDSEIESTAFDTLKQQLEDYRILIEGMQIANDADAVDYRSLCDFAGSEVLDGENIFCQMENANHMKESYLSGEDFFRRKMAAEEEPLLSLYYRRKAEQYAHLADNSRRLYEKWLEKTERFDEIAASTGLFFLKSIANQWASVPGD